MKKKDVEIYNDLILYISMPKLKRETQASPLTQKIVLLLFGLGPILIMILFLYSQGFFEQTNL